MFSRTLKTGLLFLAGFLASSGAAAHADNVNTSGTVCRNYNASDVMNIEYIDMGVLNLASVPAVVICPVVRSPISSASSIGWLYVDGYNGANTSTTCSVNVYNFNGDFEASQTFTASGGASGKTWDQLVQFSSGQLTTYAYVNVLCTIPGNFQGVILGVTAVQS